MADDLSDSAGQGLQKCPVAIESFTAFNQIVQSLAYFIPHGRESDVPQVSNSPLEVVIEPPQSVVDFVTDLTFEEPYLRRQAIFQALKFLRRVDLIDKRLGLRQQGSKLIFDWLQQCVYICRVK